MARCPLDLRACLALDREVHVILSAAAENARRLRFIAKLWPRIGPLLTLVSNETADRTGQEPHFDMVPAARSGDAAAMGPALSRWPAHLLDDASFRFRARLGPDQGATIAAHGVQTVTATTKVDFLREMLSGACRIVRGSVARVGGRSVTLTFGGEVLRTGAEAEHAQFSTAEVFVDAATHASRESPAPVRTVLSRRVTAAGAAPPSAGRIDVTSGPGDHPAPDRPE
jgi:acyl-CoA thioesterase FadM